MTTWTLIRFAHLTGIIFFVGGQLVLLPAITPVLRTPGNEEAMRAIARRFGMGSAVALVAIVASGAALASHFGLWDDPVLHAKLGVLGLVGVLLGLHVASTQTRAISLALTASSLLIVWLGLKLTYG